jgi:lipopolysaccharide export system protein LptA
MSGKKIASNGSGKFLFGLCAFILLCFPVHADTFTYSGDRATTILAEGSQHALLTGNARVDTQDLRITADSIELFGKDFVYAQCHGNVRVVDAKRGLDLTSQELFYDRNQKIARIKGNAVMADLKNQMVVKGGFIEDRDLEKVTIVQIGVRIFKKDITCKAEFAKYWRDKKTLELSGLPWVSKGSDVYQAARITINLDTEDISLEGDVQGTIKTGTNEPAKNAAGAADGSTTPVVPTDGSAAPAVPVPAPLVPGSPPPAVPAPAPTPPAPLAPDSTPPMKKGPPGGQ